MRAAGVGSPATVGADRADQQQVAVDAQAGAEAVSGVAFVGEQFAGLHPLAVDVLLEDVD